MWPSEPQTQGCNSNEYSMRCHNSLIRGSRDQVLSSLLFSAAQLIRSEIQVTAETDVRSFSTIIQRLRRILFFYGELLPIWNLLSNMISSSKVRVSRPPPGDCWKPTSLCLGPLFSPLGMVTSVSFEIVRVGPALRYVQPLYEKRLHNDTKKFRNWLLRCTTVHSKVHSSGRINESPRTSNSVM